MKQKIFEALKAKFPGVNANVLNRIADKLAKTVTTDEQVTTAVAGVTQEFIEVIESYGDSRATEAQQTAVRNYEQQHGLKDGKPVSGSDTGGGQQQQTPTVTTTTTTPAAGGTEATPAWAQALIQQNNELKARLDRMDGDRTTATRKSQLSAIYAKLPEKLRKPYERISVDALTDEQFATLLTEVTTEVDGLAADVAAKGAIFGRPAAPHGSNNTGDGKLTAEQEAAIAKRDGAPKEGQPF